MERRTHMICAAALCLFVTLPLPTNATGSVCAEAVAETERAYRVPRLLLQAVSLAESGRWDAKTRRSHAWPWTVMAKGKGTFHTSRAKAIAAVRTLRAEGVRNIDVGCMQINLMHHATAFENLEQAFEPAINAG